MGDGATRGDGDICRRLDGSAASEGQTTKASSTIAQGGLEDIESHGGSLYCLGVDSHFGSGSRSAIIVTVVDLRRTRGTRFFGFLVVLASLSSGALPPPSFLACSAWPTQQAASGVAKAPRRLKRCHEVGHMGPFPSGTRHAPGTVKSPSQVKQTSGVALKMTATCVNTTPCHCSYINSHHELFILTSSRTLMS